MESLYQRLKWRWHGTNTPRIPDQDALYAEAKRLLESAYAGWLSSRELNVVSCGGLEAIVCDNWVSIRCVPHESIAQVPDVVW